jgi:hypothetical protein
MPNFISIKAQRFRTALLVRPISHVVFINFTFGRGPILSPNVALFYFNKDVTMNGATKTEKFQKPEVAKLIASVTVL